MVCTPRSTYCQGRTNQAHTIQKARTTQLKCSACQQGKQGTAPAPAAADTIPHRKTCSWVILEKRKRLPSSCRSATASPTHCSENQRGKQRTGPVPAAADTIPQGKTSTKTRRWQSMIPPRTGHFVM